MTQRKEKSKILIRHGEQKIRNTKPVAEGRDKISVLKVNLADIKQRGNGDAHIRLTVQRYEGETCEGVFQGGGLACFDGGHVYKGMFSKGLMDGYGVFTWAGGLKYEGEFVRNQPMGEGTYIWPDSSTYKGEVCYGIQHGTGTYTCAKDCVSYTGQWDQGKRHGKGEEFYNQEKTSWYKGDWVRNIREGCGVRCYPSGNVYSGEWKNNLRHGKGTMKWLKLGEEYDGMWQNGVQHGQGTHTWILKRADGSQYTKSNRYTGDFVQGQRHGLGTFYYAGGAIYVGQWRNNKKHGKGKFTFKNGHVFEGDFVNDQMMTDILNGQRAPTPFCGPSPLPGSDSSILGLDMALNIDCLLDKIPERNRNTEQEQVEFVVLKLATELRSVYNFYSKLGRAHSPNNTFPLSRLQLWRLLKDCYIHHHSITLTKIDHFIKDAPMEELHSPFTPILFRGLLSCLVVVAYHIYHEHMVSKKNLLAACFSKLMTENILPNAENVKGFLFSKPCGDVMALDYLKKCWEIYQTYCKVYKPPRNEQIMTCRQLLWMFKDLNLLDNNLTVRKLLQIITSESSDPSNFTSCLDLEITFLEFLEVLLGSAEVKCKQVSGGSEKEGAETEAGRDGCKVEAGEKVTGISQESSASEGVEGQQNVETTFEENLQSAEGHRGKEKRTRKEEAEDHELQLWKQTIHQFFNHFFFPAYEHNQLVSKKMKEEKL
ncbi:radial spoke head 10 homolog B isoform X1 [Xyrichtys novacula]|uniref:Radial spoke head 10 homolog B isoform X1 n=1 Tax=Xyrichtys novacula TaxID=13765 RepID=A0AAV1H5A3_XYRNO|nr:radial spoke head 10 homolog B isoform X1 [Xyrichtys novacula]